MTDRNAVPFLVGALLGFGLGMLFAPQAGTATRKQLRELAHDTAGRLSTGLGRNMDLYEDARAAVKEAITAGRHAYLQELERFRILGTETT